MKANSTFSIVLYIFLLSLSSCVTDLFEKEELTPPEVTITNIENNEFNESIIYFTVSVAKNKTTDFIGIAMNTTGSPRTEEGQKLFSGATGDLFINLGALSADTIYYIKAFAGNGSGFAESNVYVYTPAAPVPVSAPCTLNIGQVTDGGSIYTIDNSIAGSRVSRGGGNYGIEATYFSIAGTRVLAFNFQKKPVNGRYMNTTSSEFNQFSDEIYINFFNSEGTFKAGKYVYISIQDDDIADVEFCDLEYEFLGTTYLLSGSFQTRL